MNEQNPVVAGQAPASESFSLESLSKEELSALIAQAQDILAQREREERDKALDEIQKIARAHGLKISVQDAKAKRGRPRKKPQGAG